MTCNSRAKGARGERAACKVTVSIPLPDTKIVQPKGHWRSKAKPIRAQREEACLLARPQAPTEPWGRAAIRYRIFYPDRRRRDVVNTMHGCKGAVDGIVDAGVIVDDCWTCLRITEPEIGVDKANPRVELHVWNEEVAGVEACAKVMTRLNDQTGDV